MLRDLPRIRRGLLEYLRVLSEQHGETVLLPLLSPTYLLNNPEHIKHILVTNPRNYHKTAALTVGRDLFGQGLVSSEAPLHTRQRRLMQPMFHRHTIAGFAGLMTDAAVAQTAAWRDGATVNLSDELMRLALTITGRALFSTDLSGRAAELGPVFTEAQRLVTRRLQVPFFPLWLPTPTNRQYRSVVRRIDKIIAELIAARRNQPEAVRPDDLLTMLLAARFEDGSPMTDRQLRDEVVTLMAAGHETVANQMTWTWYLLSQHPGVEEKLTAELRTILGGRVPTLADVPALRYTEMTLAESLRLYPPVWTLARKVVKDDTLPGGLVLRAGSEVLMSQFIFHRNATYFPNPDGFDPERFNPEKKADWPAFAYFPFGSGPRFCIGDAFAKLEAVLVLATIGQRFQLRLAPDQKIALEPLITLRPRYGMRMTVQVRSSEPARRAA